MEEMEIRRFDVLLVDLAGAVGSEQKKIRPCVVVGNDMSNRFSPVILVMPLTHVNKKAHIPTHKYIKKEVGSGLTTDSTLIGEQPTPIDRQRIKEKLGKISNKASQNMIDQACYEAFFYKKEVQGKGSAI